jgi:hypothetical protein
MADLVELLTVAGGEKGALERRPDPPPRERRYTVISVDDHFIEPPDLFEGRLSSALADRAPHVVRHDDADWWVFEDQQVPLLGSEAIQTWLPGKGHHGPVRFDEIRRATWDVHERVRDMDVNGVTASLNFPSAPFGFAGQVFMRMRDHELGLASMRAYNDWIIEEWVAPYPERMIPCQLTWLHNPQIAAVEIERNATRGFKAVTFSENPPLQARIAVDPPASLGSVLARVRGDRDGGEPAHRLVVGDGRAESRLGAGPRGALPDQRAGRVRRLALRRCLRTVPEAEGGVLGRRDRLGADAARPHRLQPTARRAPSALRRR